MKRILLYLFTLLTALCTTACMGVSEKEYQTTYQRLTVAETDPITQLFTIDGYKVTSSALDTLPDLRKGDCFQVDFKGRLLDDDFDQLYDVDFLSIVPIPVWPMAEAFTDTTLIYKDEKLLSKVTLNRVHNYLNGRLFAYINRDYYRRGETINYQLSYNPDSVALVENRIRVYDLYLRLVTSGGADSIRTTSLRVTDAFVIDDFLREAGKIEQQADRDSIFFRIKYPRSYNADSTAWATWTTTDFIALPVPE